MKLIIHKRRVADSNCFKPATDGASGFDLRPTVTTSTEIAPMEYKRICTGVSLIIPKGYEGQIRSRSGVAEHYGLIVLNSPATIDSDYRGELQVLLMNLGKKPVHIHSCMKIAQFVLAPIVPPSDVELEHVEILPQDTARGSQGFGSTGL